MGPSLDECERSLDETNSGTGKRGGQGKIGSNDKEMERHFIAEAAWPSDRFASATLT